ncbi:major tail protein [Pediococcus inopinatus]|uniref:major tail protein n=1 Tax=Pediococcus inopinatus TaxID=114090 RepID=UPI0009EE040D|nr:major tail protein [Pediococcus inopinatus]
MFVGYKRLKITIFTEEGTAAKTVVVQGDPHKGATVTAEVSGLAKDPVKVAGSDIDYYLSRQGLGDAKVALGVLDLPEDVADELSGFKIDENKISYGGADTLPPYCSIEMESAEDTGEVALVGFYRGTFTRDKIDFNTLDSSKSFTPEADSWTYTPVSSTAEGVTNGEIMQKFVGKDDAAVKAFESQLSISAAGSVTAPTDSGASSSAPASSGASSAASSAAK